MIGEYTHVIWDFNGTIYDDVNAGLQSANRLLRAHGLCEIGSIEEYRAVFGFPIIDYYRRMGFDFEQTPYDALANEWIPYYMEATRDATVYPAVMRLLSDIKERGIAQILLSATEHRMLCEQLENLQLRDYFDEVLGQDTIHAHGKQAIGLAWRERHSEARLLLVGDTAHDAQVAAAMGADCALIACGHQLRATLEQCACLAVYDRHDQFYLEFFTK